MKITDEEVKSIYDGLAKMGILPTTLEMITIVANLAIDNIEKKYDRLLEEYNNAWMRRCDLLRSELAEQTKLWSELAGAVDDLATPPVPEETTRAHRHMCYCGAVVNANESCSVCHRK
jgi:hypothetical protein